MTVDITPEAVELLAQANKNSDTTDANMWRFWADKASALSAALAASQAETAAAYERSAQVADYEASQCGPSYGNGYPQKSAWSIASTIRALTPADSKAALDRMIAEARADGMREAVDVIYQHGQDCLDDGRFTAQVHAIETANEVLAAIPKGTPHE